MYYRDEVIRYLQSNNILALKLDHAISGVGSAVLKQIETAGAGARRLLYYTSCFTDEYQDVCQRQKTEDIRFAKAVIHIIRNGDVIYEMLKIYFEQIFKHKTSDQLEHIKKRLMAVNVHIAASTLSSHGFTLAAAMSVAVGLNMSHNMSVLTGHRVSKMITGVGLYGVVQLAADSAHRLHFTYPAYYAALYTQELEMMYFLIEPMFERVGALKSHWASEAEISDIIRRMIG